jgi:hypothetical protein
MLEDATTSCTYNNYMPVSGTLNLNNGKLYLNKDLILTNTFIQVTSGKIFGNNYSLELPHSVVNLNLPGDSGFYVSDLSTMRMGKDCTSIDWSINDDYIAATALYSSDYDLKIAYFDGASLTVTLQLYQSRDSYSVRWHPTKQIFGCRA